MYNVGMYGGSFDPVHIGHVQVMIKAASMCEKLNVVISYSKKRDRIDIKYRYRWIKNILSHLDNVNVIVVEDMALSKEEYDSSDYWDKGAKEIKNKIGEKIDVVFAGSDYRGRGVFEKLYSESKIYYFDRENVKISSTEIYNKPFKYWDYIPDEIKYYFVKKILIIGGESTGKSTLAMNLAKIYNTEWVEEKGREICEKAGGEEYMNIEDLQKCLIYQKEAMWDKEIHANKLLFIDTDAYITKFYIQFLLEDDEKSAHEKDITEKLADAIGEINEFDEILFLEPDTKFVQDGTRNEIIGNDREKYSNMIKDIFNLAGYEYHTIKGSYIDKLEQTMQIIDELF